MASIDPRLKLEIELIEKNHFLSVKQIASSLEVSEMTVRRDLQNLVERGLVRLVYGGVTPAQSVADSRNYSFQNEQARNTEQKIAIASRAAQFIEPNDVIFLDSGSTIQLLAERIPPNPAYTLITSSLNTLNVIVQLPNSTIITPGGVFSQKPVVFYDIDSIKFIRKYRANKAFVGATGYELNLGLTCGYIEDAPLKQAIIESSKDRILLVDSSKFGKVSTCLFAKIDDFSAVITDSGIPEEYAEHIRSCNVELIIV
jgi:DeoR family transcriptional regulator, deoxyribose operon repressor